MCVFADAMVSLSPAGAGAGAGAGVGALVDIGAANGVYCDRTADVGALVDIGAANVDYIDFLAPSNSPRASERSTIATSSLS